MTSTPALVRHLRRREAALRASLESVSRALAAHGAGPTRVRALRVTRTRPASTAPATAYPCDALWREACPAGRRAWEAWMALPAIEGRCAWKPKIRGTPRYEAARSAYLHLAYGTDRDPAIRRLTASRITTCRGDATGPAPVYTQEVLPCAAS